MNPIERVAYDLGQAARVAWFYAHAGLAGRLAPPVVEPAEIDDPLPTLQQMMGDLYELFRRDRANIEAGYYRLPHDLFGSPRAALAQSFRFLSDLGRVDRRRREGIHDEVRATPDGLGRALPRLLRAEFPLSDRRLFQRSFGGGLRLPGRGPVQGQRRRDAPPGAGAAAAASCATGRYARSVCWTWGAVPGGS